MHVVRLRDVVRRNPSPVGPDETVQEGAESMARDGMPAIPVTENGKVIGILTDRDVSKKVVAMRLDPTTTLVASIMNSDPVRICDDRDIDSAILVMRARGVQELLVQDFSGSYLGIVCNCDLCNCQWETE